MRTVMVMFDTLTRKFLPNYGCDWTKLPNFARLADHCTRFDNFYSGSLPCMPARRELHTGKYNFLHRGWGPLEPFDRSVFEVLRQNGVYSHLCTDHSHYWEDGGATYHNRYDTWEGFRGQEGDRYVAHDIRAEIPPRASALNKAGISVEQHYRNRTRQRTEDEMSGTRTVRAGLEFLAEHADRDDWFLQIECFDPHEPFYVPQNYRALYGLPEQETLNWPRYGRVPGGDYHRDLEDAAREYAALLSMCDAHLGKILDFMDSHDMWKDTALIVNTDHGFLLGEHDFLGKNFMPLYDEMVHLPFFLHLPGQQGGGACSALCATVDIAPTLLDLYGYDAAALGETDGQSLLPAVRDGRPGHGTVLFGVHGMYTCCTDGAAVLMKATADPQVQMYDYTMMPTNMRGYFSAAQLDAAELVRPGRYANGLPCLRMPLTPLLDVAQFGDRLYCLDDDPGQQDNRISDTALAETWMHRLAAALRAAGAPEEEFRRLGLPC